jgi:hypothetical protein
MWVRTRRAGEFPAHSVGRVPFESVDELRYRQGGRVSDEQADVVGLAVELDDFGVETGAHLPHGVLGGGEHGVGEHLRAVFRHEYQVGQ